MHQFTSASAAGRLIFGAECDAKRRVGFDFTHLMMTD